MSRKGYKNMNEKKEIKRIRIPAIHFVFEGKTQDETLEYYKNMYNSSYKDSKLELEGFEDINKFTNGIIFCKDVFIFKDTENEQDKSKE